uniref:Uncharacterized protein n=1 Tax=Meloidogyne floridensis TaxID=298350 RepID=A0A915NTP4_9BILA
MKVYKILTDELVFKINLSIKKFDNCFENPRFCLGLSKTEDYYSLFEEKVNNFIIKYIDEQIEVIKEYKNEEENNIKSD